MLLQISHGMLNRARMAGQSMNIRNAHLLLHKTRKGLGNHIKEAGSHSKLRMHSTATHAQAHTCNHHAL